jgi:hypothetical protein
MVERGALLLLEGDVSLSMEDIYSLLAEENYGCTWDYYQAYCHLKGFGYIVGRHNCPWTLKSEEYKPMSSCASCPEGRMSCFIKKCRVMCNSTTFQDNSPKLIHALI